MQLVLSSHHFLFSTNHHRRRHHHPRNYISFNLPNPNQPPNAATSTTTTTSTTTVSKSAITRIAEKLKNLGFTDDARSPNPNPNPNSTIGEIFVPNSRQIPVHRVGHTLDRSWSSPVNPVPSPGSGNAIARLSELKEVVKKERREMRKVENERRVPSVVELGLPDSERRRLMTLGIRMKQKMKLGKAGITEGVVNGIHERWAGCEVVKVVCEDINRLNMKRTHDLLERKTGGVVVWRAGSKIILYRGVDYKYPYFSLDEVSVDGRSPNPSNLDNGLQVEENPPERHVGTSAEQSSTKVPDRSSVVQGVGSPTRVRFLLPGEKQLVEEADHLLEGLGPRFTDWWGCDPLPIDGDLLPAIVSGYQRPFRLLPYGVKPQLTNDEMTILKRLGRPLPCHFALGRNRNLQGLAAAIVKLWEKCEIAKIAIKRGVQNTSSELMAEELKRLTGGILLSRDKEFIVFYRGKDFLPSAVSSAIEERRKSRMQSNKQLQNDSITLTGEDPLQIFQGITYANKSEASKVLEVTRGSEEHKKSSIEAAIKKNTKKLSMGLEEKEKAEKLLSELEQAVLSQQVDIDKEGITEEERYMLRRVGLRMKPFLLLGRRGVFDGTVENMHLHWKYRELIKIICNGRDIDETHRVARILEAESGGILVAVERVRNGHAIIVYRGKNYQRPARLRPQTLLNKKEALKRSIEAQRRQSLKLNVLEISRNIEKLKLKLAEDEESLDTKEGEQLKMLKESEKELDPTISDGSSDFEEGDQPSFQQRNLVNVCSLKDESHQNADQHSPSSVCLPTGPDTGLREKTSTGISDCGDNSETICSEMNGLSDSSCVQGSISSLHSTGSESEPVINFISDGSSEHGLLKLHEESSNKQSEPSFDNNAVKDSPAAPARARPLTNKERLLLRKQALTMKKRPVLAVGRSNVVTGVAKAIRDHFRKYPLAIVNVKGRAKGTSVQEVVYQLEQATGGVLVSQEPSKIILYRGWGGGVDKGKHLDKHAHVPSGAVSPELIAAMRVECGLELETD